jgi:hypothetical protein
LRPLEDGYLVAERQHLDLEQGASAKPRTETNHRGNASREHRGTLTTAFGKFNHFSLNEIIGWHRSQDFNPEAQIRDKRHCISN